MSSLGKTLNTGNILDSHTLQQAMRHAKAAERLGDVEKAKLIYQDILLRFPKNRKAKENLESLVPAEFVGTKYGQEPSQEQGLGTWNW